MIDEKCLTRLILNTLRGNWHTNCRLCFHSMNRRDPLTFKKLDERTSFLNKKNCLTFGQVLGTVLGNEFSAKICSVEAVCLVCADKALGCMKFIEDYKTMTKMLHNTINTLTESFNSVESVSENQKLYVVLGDNESEMILLDKYDLKPDFSVLNTISGESNEVNLNKIVSDIVNGHQYIHCRLCLKEIQNNAVYFEDYVSFSKENLTLGHILITLLGDSVSEKIIGLDAVCSVCLKRAMECMRFVNKCRRLNITLNKIFNNLAVALNSVKEPKEKNKKLCIIVGEENSKLVLFKEDRRRKSRRKPGRKPKKTNFDSTDEEELTRNELAAIMSKKTKIKKMQRVGIPCTQCKLYKYLPSEESLREHIAQIHELCVCQECGVSVRGLNMLQIHEQRHKANDKRCLKCNRTFFSKAAYYKHVAKCNVGSIVAKKNTKTKNATKKSKNIGSVDLRANEKMEPAKVKLFKCKLCSLKCKSVTSLMRHTKKHTGNSQIFSCSKCPKTFCTKKLYQLHERTDHPEGKPFACEICQERFKSDDARNRHAKFSHTIPKITCAICSQRFHTEKYLLTHRRKHDDPTSHLYVGKNVLYSVSVDDLTRMRHGPRPR